MDGLKGIARGVSVPYGRNNTVRVGRLSVGAQAEEAKQSYVKQDTGEAKQGLTGQDTGEAKQGFVGQDAGRAKQGFVGLDAEEAKQGVAGQDAREAKQGGAGQDAGEAKQGIAGQDAGATKQGLTGQEAEERRKKAKEQEEASNRILEQLKAQAEAIRKAFDPKKRRNLYDATMDLTLIAQMEKIPGLKAMQSRLMFQMRSVKASGAETSEIRAAVNKLKKVVGKVKTKIKALEKEGVMEKKRKRAAEAKRKAKELALRRELEWRKKARKAREQKDIEESKMGMGANYGGPTGDPALDMAMEAFESMESAAMTLDVGAVVDVAVADVGVAADAGGGAVDVSI